MSNRPKRAATLHKNLGADKKVKTGPELDSEATIAQIVIKEDVPAAESTNCEQFRIESLQETNRILMENNANLLNLLSVHKKTMELMERKLKWSSEEIQKLEEANLKFFREMELYKEKCKAAEHKAKMFAKSDTSIAETEEWKKKYWAGEKDRNALLNQLHVAQEEIKVLKGSNPPGTSDNSYIFEADHTSFLTTMVQRLRCDLERETNAHVEAMAELRRLKYEKAKRKESSFEYSFECSSSTTPPERGISELNDQLITPKEEPATEYPFAHE